MDKADYGKLGNMLSKKGFIHTVGAKPGNILETLVFKNR